MYTIVR